jgi:hypothetical protein
LAINLIFYWPPRAAAKARRRGIAAAALRLPARVAAKLKALRGQRDLRVRVLRQLGFFAEAVVYNAGRRMKAAAGVDLTVGGPRLAGQATRAGLVDDYHLLLTPLVVGGGTPALPDGVRLELEPLDERRFGGGVVHLHNRTET